MSPRLLAYVPACLLAVLSFDTTAVALQEGPDRGDPPARQARLTPEKAEAAWKWQAKGVARETTLTEEETTKLMEAYVASRKHLQEAQREARQAEGDRGGGRGDRAGGMRIDPKLREQERKALETSVGAFLKPEATKEVVASLGIFAPPWDQMVDVVLGFKLEEEKTYSALVPIRKYVVALAKLREDAEREAIRETMQAERQKLMEELGKVLSEEQVKQFEQATTRRGGGRPGGPPDAGGAVGSDRPGGQAQVGEPAPDFTLEDPAGTSHTLASYRGKVVVLQWINPDCPVCRGVCSSGKVASMLKGLHEISDDVVLLMVNSTHYMEPSTSAAYLKQHSLPGPALIDRSGSVGRLYGARTTPHMFVIDAEGVLRYQGAFDDNPQGGSGDKATNFVVQAVRQIVAGETVSPDSTRPYGCSVKYAPSR